MLDGRMFTPLYISQQLFSVAELRLCYITTRCAYDRIFCAIRDPNRCPSHPGELLREDALPALGLPKTKVASLLGISRQHLYDILEERKPVSPAVAVRLGKLLGDGAGVWVRMQAAYDTWHAEREVDVSAIPTIRARA